jgi:hypothetical protein
MIKFVVESKREQERGALLRARECVYVWMVLM